MASRQRGIFERILFGSDSHHEVQHADADLEGRRPSGLVSDDENTLQHGESEKKIPDISIQAASPPTSSESPQTPSAPTLAELWRSPTLHSLSEGLQHGWRTRNDPCTAWHPSFLRLRPLIGLLALVVTICSLFGSLIVLLVSDKQPTQEWPVAPTVFLAILTAIGNSAMMVARSQAIPNAWWYNASRGASVRMLERQWEVSTSLTRALLHARRHFSLLNPSCVAASLAIIDGALLQRASTFAPAWTTSNVTLDLVLPPELPTGFSGVIWHGAIYESETASNVCDDWTYSVPIQMDVPQCEGTCYTSVRAPGVVKVNTLSTQTWPITPEILSSMNGSWGPWHGYGPPLQGTGPPEARNPIFFVSLLGASQMDVGDAFDLTYGIANWSPNAEGQPYGSYVQETSTYSPAILEYDVSIEGNVVSIVGDASQARFIALANNTANTVANDYAVQQVSTIDQITSYLTIFVQANASAILFEGGTTYLPDILTFNAEAQKAAGGGGTLDILYANPTDSIIAQFNSLMFRGGVVTGATWANATRLMDRGVSVNQTVQATQKLNQNVYNTNLRWFAGAAVLQLTAVALILPMFWGFWTLGASTNMSPFSIAIAFDAPLFKDVPSAAGAKGVVGQLGSTELRYGLVREGIDPAREGVVRDAEGKGAPPAGRLGIAKSGQVSRPSPGMRFTS